LYWKLLDVVAKDTGNDKDDLHEYCKEKFLLHRRVDLGGSTIEVPASTKRLSVKEFKLYFEQVEAFFAVNLNITLPYNGTI